MQTDKASRKRVSDETNVNVSFVKYTMHMNVAKLCRLPLQSETREGETPQDQTQVRFVCSSVIKVLQTDLGAVDPPGCADTIMPRTLICFYSKYHLQI